jgi:proteic killer suppression protein
MIVSIRHRALKRLWTRDDASKLPADQVGKIRNILTLINAATVIEDLRYPGSFLHPLKGELAGYWSVTVKANWRIIFRFERGNAYLLDYLDYH